MSRVLWFAPLALFACARLSIAGEMKAEMDCAADYKLLDTQFARYGHTPLKTILRDGPRVRIRLPALKNGVGQTGIYSYFVLAGDFEVLATYELIGFVTPAKGYGTTCGIGVDTEGPGGSVSLARGQQVKEKPGYIVTRGLPGEGGETKYETTHFPGQAKFGRLILRREKNELICLVGEGKKEPEEIQRIPFTLSTIKKVRIFADSGGSPEALDARLGNIKIRADEITGSIPKSDMPGGIGWLVVAGLFVVAAIAYYVFRRRQVED